jgi:lipid-A-disaccharide synthase-like uncharacterized protein
MSTVAFWLLVGFSGQVLFTGRFLVQWLASERQGDSVVPLAFWWLSLGGGTAMLAYAISRRDSVFMTGQALGLLVYVRNLMLSRKGAQRALLGRCSVCHVANQGLLHSGISQALGN